MSKATAACELLVKAYDRGLANSGSIDWADVDLAHEAAKTALASPGASMRDVARAFIALLGAVSPEDLSMIRQDCQRIEGWYPLAAFTRDSVLEDFRTIWADFPELPSLAETACEEVFEGLQGAGADSETAIDRAVTRIVELAREQGIELVDAEGAERWLVSR